MISFAYGHIPYYKERFDEVGVHPEDIKREEDLLGLPALRKDDIRNSLGKLTGGFKPRSGRWRQTSGSSGTPLRLVKDSTSLAMMDAVMYRNYRWHDIGMGEAQARFWGGPLDLKGRSLLRLKDFLLNRIRFSPFNLSGPACKDFLKELRAFRPRYVYGYAQTIFGFAQYLVRQGQDLGDLNLKAVIVTGEMIYDEQIETIQKGFCCGIFNEYGCTEVGIIAMQCPDGGMHLMAENLFIEFIKDGRPAKPGEEGEILVTELYGGLMPLLRYQLGDRGIPDSQKCSCGRGLPLLKRLQGRSDEFIRCPDGRKVDPIVFEYVLKSVSPRYGTVTQFRVVQEADYRLGVDLCYQGSDPERMCKVLEKKMQEAVGWNLPMAFRLKDRLSVDPSGKLRCFVSRFKD